MGLTWCLHTSHRSHKHFKLLTSQSRWLKSTSVGRVVKSTCCGLERCSAVISLA
ncbi:mCG1044331 [Mus musculus]|nr:mCG1044331 [Mus musculus]